MKGDTEKLATPKRDLQKNILEILARMNKPVPSSVICDNCLKRVGRYATRHQIASMLGIMARQGVIETENYGQHTLYYTRGDNE